ncbi:MAG TPA: ABC transporter permease [Gemmatimonadales bacterium]|jgi:predicted permease
MGSLLQDLRYAIRSLARTPGFTLVAVLTLALGIGANTAIFSMLYGVLLRPLPYPEAARLVGFQESFRGSAGEMDVTWSEYRFLEQQGGMFESLGASAQVGLNVFTGSEALRFDGLRVSANYFKTLGVQPLLGRSFNQDEDREGGANAVMLSWGVWQSRFAGDAGIVGRTISLDGKPSVVVGVMPRGFQSQPDAEVWTTLGQVAQTIGSGQNIGLIARLKPGIELAAAQAAFVPLEAAYRHEFAGIVSKDLSMALARYRDVQVVDLRAPVRVLFGAIGFVLLIACANVASLVLGRTAGRSRELAVRVAIGASAWRVARQLVTESVVLALAGGAAGVLLAGVGLDFLVKLVPYDLSRGGDIRLDALALCFAFAISLLTGVLFGLAPAWRMMRGDLSNEGALKSSAGRISAGAGQMRLRHGLVVVEVALSLVLLVGAGLLIETFARLVRTDAGFDVGHVASARIWLTGSGYDSTAAITGFYRQLDERLSALPGVQSAAVVEAGLPLQRGGNMPVRPLGEERIRSTDYRTVTPNYFQTLGIALRRGRSFTDADAAGAPVAIVVNESYAKNIGGDSAIGRRLHVGGEGGVDGEVVGIVGDVKSFVGSPAVPSIFLASAQTPAGFTRIFSSWFPIHVVVRTSGDPASVLAALPRIIREVNPQVPIGTVETMSDVLASSLSFQRFIMTMLSVFAALAIVLAAVGLYGVISYLVAQRTHEIGVRMALGARRIDVLRLVLGRGMILAGTGAALGVGGALALTRLIASQLYDVRPTDFLTYAAVTVLLIAVALAACAIPARRASRTDPMIALRSE